MLSERERALLIAQLRRGRAEGGAAQIPRRGPEAVHPRASFGQEQLWFLDKLAPGQAIYNVLCAIRARGPLDTTALARALERLADRHETLRTRLVPDGEGRPVQVIGPPWPMTLGMEDFTMSGPAERDALLRAYILAEAMRSFDLAEGPLLRASLARLAESEHLLVAVVHHAVFDGWSAGVFLRDLAALYAAEVTGKPSGLAVLPVQFADYAVWRRQHMDGPALAGLESYWRQRLAGFETLRFPTDRPRPAIDDFTGGLAERMTSAVLLAGLREVSRREGSTLSTILLTSLLALLHRYTGQSDLVVGTVSANRDRAELEPLIGFLVNTLAIRCDLSGDPVFRDVLAQVRDVSVGAFAHQGLPFANLVDALKVDRDPSRTPVFQIIFTHAERDDMPVRAADMDFTLSDLVRGLPVAHFDLAFTTEARRDGLWVECSYKTALFDPGTIERLLGNLEMLLHGVVTDPSARLSELPLLTEAELRAELHDWNDTAAPVQSGSAHQAFEAQAARTPDAIAAEHEGRRITYRELNRQANQIAQPLRARGVGPQVLVGVCMRTSLRRLAALLGIWKAGGGYVPLDPELPADRLAFMIGDTGMSVILTDAACAARVPGSGNATVVDLDAEWDRITSSYGENLASTGSSPPDAAYVLYTSGSTGQPKGVIVEHRNVVNSLHGMVRRYGIGPADVILQFASIAFDASVQEMFMPLLAGARVVLAAAETLHSPTRLAALMHDAGITFACLTPAVLGMLPAGRYPDLRIMIAAGEELPAELARRWIRHGLRLVNAYGPTETTVDATYADLDAASQMPPPIGFPAGPNCRAYVLDPYLNPVPCGVTGELHIGGASVARGYLNRPELTGERFIPDPFTPGERIYKTGDLVRRRPDGSIVFIGRVDSQVKVRGLRIELGEIETALAAHPAVAQAIAAVIAGPGGEQEIAAYLRPVPGAGTFDEAAVRDDLTRTLPAWMIPAHLIMVDTFPLNPSGKVDRRALPVPRRRRAERQAMTTPEGRTETVLAGLFATLLGIDGVGATDSFFDLGGNSMTAMRLVAMIGHETGADIGVTSIFLHPTPRRLAAAIESCVNSVRAPWVELNSGSAGSPLFLIHPVGGTVSAYAQLGRELADTFKVYGLESPALGDSTALASSLTDLVADYTQRIQAIQPAGSYALAGWSMGGIIAFEIAQRLEHAGTDVSQLILLDAPHTIPADHERRQDELAGRFVADVAQSLGWNAAQAPDPATASPAGQFAWLAAQMTGTNPETTGPGEQDAVTARLRRRFDVFEAHNKMIAGYRPAGPPVRAPALVVSAAQSPNAAARSQWPGLLDGPVSVLSLDSDHYAFLRPPLVADVGAAIRTWHDDQRKAGIDGR